MARTKGRAKKSKAKKTTSQPDANTEVIPPAPVSLCETPQIDTMLGKRKADSKSLSGFIFMCNGRTKPECYWYRVFGLPAGRSEDVEKVKKGMKLFLYDFDVKLLYGVYEATSDGQMNLEPSAFGGKFPAQVSFAIHKECLPLREIAFKHAIRDNYEGFKFKAELTHQQVEDLLSLFPALTATSVAPIPQVASSQPIWHSGLADQFPPLVMQPPSQDPYLAGAQPAYAALTAGPQSVQRVLNDPYFYAQGQRPYLAGDTGQIAQDPYSRYVGPQQMASRDQFANVAGVYYNTYPNTATSHGPQLTHPPHMGIEYDPQRENVARSYTPYPIPATSQGYPVMHHLHGGREFDPQRGDVARSYTPYPIPATSQGPPVMHRHEQLPGMPLMSFPVSSNYFLDGAKQVYR